MLVLLAGSPAAPAGVLRACWQAAARRGNRLEAHWLAGGKVVVFFAWVVRPGDVVAQGVPEPGTAALLGAALGLLGWQGRARRHSMIRSFG